MDWKNRLYFGDNLDILRRELPDDSVDLIYLDPPFNSNATHNVLFKEKSGEESAAQIMAFEDTWQWGLESEAVYKEIVTGGPEKLVDLLRAMTATSRKVTAGRARVGALPRMCVCLVGRRDDPLGEPVASPSTLAARARGRF